MEKKKECKKKNKKTKTQKTNMRKWKLFFIVLAKERRQEKSLQKYCHFFICS